MAGMTELVLADGVARLALGFGTRPEEAGLEACAALAGHFENAWDEYVGNWHGFLPHGERAPGARPGGGSRALPDIGGGPADPRGSHRPGRDRGQPVDPVGQHAQRPGWLPPGLVARPRRVGRRARRARRPPDGPPDARLPGRDAGARRLVGPEPVGGRRRATGRASSSTRPPTRSCSRAPSGGAGPPRCTAWPAATRPPSSTC